MFERLKRLFFHPPKSRSTRGFQELTNNQLFADWMTSTDDPNLRLTQHLGAMRRMSRDMAETNHYAVSYLNLRVKNVIGPDGFKFQSMVSNRDGSPDEYARMVIEREWRSWKQAGNCTVNGESHYNDECRLNERTLGTDGEVFIMVYPGFMNLHRFAIKSFEPDFIDHEYNVAPGRLPNSPNSVIMGREVTPSGKCVACWVDGAHPGALHEWGGNKRRSRIPMLSEYLSPEMDGKAPAKSGYILHQFEVRRPNQQRGIPDLAAVTTPLRQLERTEEAHSVAARLSSCAVFQQIDQNADIDEGGGMSPGEDRMDIKPGFIAKNGMGRKWEVLQPSFPNQALPDHGKYTLKGAGSALQVAYPTWSGDLEGTSYNSGRMGSINERDGWRIRQNQTINCRERMIFNAWLRARLFFTDFGNLSESQELRYREGQFIGRSWDWVDPLKDSKGRQNDLAMKITTPQQVIRERGGDPEEIVKGWAEWEQLCKANNVTPPTFGEAITAPMATEEPPTLSKQGPVAYSSSSGKK